MGLKRHIPTTPSQRSLIGLTFEEVAKKRPERSLVEPLKRTGGRNVYGRMTVRHRGGGHRRTYRVVDFRRDKHGVPGRVAAIEYDPNRSAFLALVHYRDGEKRYMLAPAGLVPGAEVVSGPNAEPTLGNALPIAKIPLGTMIHNIEVEPGRGGQLARTAGAAAQLMAKEGDFANIRMPSGEVRMVRVACLATVGQVGNMDHVGVSDGKAGRSRWRGVRPTVRGVAMNPVDHPMGGGEGRTSGGGHPRSPWGKLAKSGKTRPKRKPSSRFIVRRRR
jgi:large subunit ribosomal protein L2